MSASPDDQRIHLVRHAHAGDPLRWDGPDATRPLSRKGRGQVERLGAFLAAAGVRPDRIISSPKVRSRETAELLGRSLGLEPVLDERLAEDCDLDQLRSIVGAAGSADVMIVGHDPYLSELLSELIGAQDQVMRKGAIATIAIERSLARGTGTLRWLVPPELLPDDREDG